MNFENLEVKHKVFGLGTVIATNGKYMTIRFDSAEKNFVYLPKVHFLHFFGVFIP